MPDYDITARDEVAFAALAALENKHGYVHDEDLVFVHPVDPETGLPTLPESYFWRISQKFSSTYINLIRRDVWTSEVRRSPWEWMLGKPKRTESQEVPRLVEDYHVSEDPNIPAEARILAAAQYLLRYLPKHIRTELHGDGLSKFIGDYPPKSLSE